MDAQSPNGLTLFDGVELKFYDRKLTPDAIFGFLSRMDDWPRKDVKFDKLFWPPTDVEIAKMLTPEALREWDFDIFRFNQITDEHPMFWITMAILHFYDLPEKLQLDITRLCRFVAMVEAGYNDCIYHNGLHAADVTHALHCLLDCQDTWRNFSPEELFSCILAAGIHDMGHPGVTNMYLVKQKHPIAERHGNTGVLEKHSWSMAFTLLDMEEYDPLHHLPKQRREDVRTLIREQVLRTDMTLHYELTKEIIALATKGVPVEGCETTPLDLKDDTQRRVALQLLVHSADLSNLCKRWEIHIQWSHAILAEFFSQGDFEKHQGLPVSEIGVRNISVGRTNQKNFIGNVVMALYKLCRDALPSTTGVCEASIEQMKKNHARWAALNY
jgi:hypothetical protein